MKGTQGVETSLPEHGDIQASVLYFNKLAVPRDAYILDIGTRFGSFLHQLWETGYKEHLRY